MPTQGQQESPLQVSKSERLVPSSIPKGTRPLQRRFGPPRLPLDDVIKPLGHQPGLLEACDDLVERLRERGARLEAEHDVDRGDALLADVEEGVAEPGKGHWRFRKRSGRDLMY